MKTTEPKSSTSTALQRSSNAAPFFQPEESREGFFGSKQSHEPFFKAASTNGDDPKPSIIQAKSNIGQRLLAHELTHPVQQGGKGRTIQRQTAGPHSPATQAGQKSATAIKASGAIFGNTFRNYLSLSTKELLNDYRATKSPDKKKLLLKVIKAKNPYKSHLGKIYKVAQSTEVLKHLPSKEANTNDFVSGPDVDVGKGFAVSKSVLPLGAKVELVEEDLHYQNWNTQIAVAKVKVTEVQKDKDKNWVGKSGWTTRTNVSPAPDKQGFYQIIKSNANVRQEPQTLKGKRRLATGTEVYIDEVKVDNFIDRKTYGLAIDASTGEEYGWIATPALEGKMDSETIGYREAQYASTGKEDNTIGNQKASIRIFKGNHYALQKETIAEKTPVKILQEDNSFGLGGSLIKVAEIQAADGSNLGWTSRSNISQKPAANGLYQIAKPQANVRSGPLPIYQSTGKNIPQGAHVKVLETQNVFSLNQKGIPEPISISKVTVYKGSVKDAAYEDVWTTSANLVGGWADYKGPNAMWSKGNYIGQTGILDVIGDIGEGRRQVAMHGGLGEKVAQMLLDAQTDNIPLSISSGFRDFKKQQQLKQTQPQNAATAGYSEHQMGNSVDLNNKSNSVVYEWLKKNAYKYKLVQTYPWFLGEGGKGGEGHHWDYRPDLAQAGYYTYFTNTFNPGVTFGSGPGQVDPRVKSTETWKTGNSSGLGQGNFRIYETATGTQVELRKN